MAEFDRLGESIEWIALEFVERERTPSSRFKKVFSSIWRTCHFWIPNTIPIGWGVDRSRTAIHNWVQKADLQLNSVADPNQIAVDETVRRVNGQHHWLYAAVDPDMNQFLQMELFQTRTTQLTVLFLRRLSEKQQVDDVTFLIDDATHLKADSTTRAPISGASLRKSEQCRTYI